MYKLKSEFLKKLMSASMFYVKTLGSGTFGTIDLYKKETDKKETDKKETDKKETDSPEHVVLKKLKKKHCHQRGYQMFKNECRILSKLTHQNIREMYNFTELTMTLEYCEGVDLFDYLGTVLFNLSYDKIMIFFVQLVDAVHYMHSKQIAHLDIKLENIMIDPETDKLKLIDFGHATDNPTISNLGGTHPYIAPEGFGKKPIIAIKADIWSLGIILYELITTSIPWEFSNEVDQTFCDYKRTNDLRLRNDIPLILSELLKYTLTIDPQKRITSDIILSKILIHKYERP